MGVYAAAVVVGVGEIARSHPLVLDGIKVFGAAYLLRLAWTTSRGPGGEPDDREDVAAERWFPRGLLISLTNPKLILFFLAVLPQFLGTAQNPRAQLAMLGAVNVLSEVVLYGTIGVMAGFFHARFAASRSGGAALGYLASVVYVVLAGVILVEMGTR